MPTHTQALCPGPCNNAYRRAEESAAATGAPNGIAPAWGQPVQCWGCVDRTHSQLLELPALLSAVREEATDGTRAKAVGTIGRVGIEHAWPGQASRLLVDETVGELAELQADILKKRGIWDDDREPARSTRADEDRHIVGIVVSVAEHWDWAMQNHPAAGEPHERGNANPGAQVVGWYWRTKTFIKDHRQPEEKRLAPCPRCRGPWLENSRDLRLVDEQPYVVCKNEDCQRVMTMAEYKTYVGAMHKAIQAAA